MPLRLMIVVLICVELLQVVQCVDHDNIQRLRKKHKKGLDNGTLKKGDNTFLQNSIPNEAVAINEGLSDVGEFHIGGNPVAYEKCDDLLLRVSGDDDLVDESEYLDFLAFVTGGEISAPTFDDLEGVFASIFLQAACTEGSSCDGETGSIFLEGTYVSNPIIFLFCTRVLQEVTTTTSLTFGYTIRYDTDSISKVRATHSPTVPPRDRSHPSFSHPTQSLQDQLSGCLEVATINLLLDNFGCERSLGPAQGQSRQLGLRGRIGEDKAATHSSDSSVSSEEHMFMDLLLREEEDRRFLSGDMSMGPSSCDYSVHAEVPSILDLGKSTAPKLSDAFRLYRDTLTNTVLSQAASHKFQGIQR